MYIFQVLPSRNPLIWRIFLRKVTTEVVGIDVTYRLLAMFPLSWGSLHTKYIPYQSSIIQVLDCLDTPPEVEAAHLRLRQYVLLDDDRIAYPFE